MLEERAAGAEAHGTCWKRFAPLAPLLAVELFESGAGFEFLFALACSQDFYQRLGCGIDGSSAGAGFICGNLSDLLRRRQIERVRLLYASSFQLF